LSHERVENLERGGSPAFQEIDAFIRSTYYGKVKMKSNVTARKDDTGKEGGLGKNWRSAPPQAKGWGPCRRGSPPYCISGRNRRKVG